VALLAGACSTGTAGGAGAAAGKSAAERSRRTVALTYWKLYNSLGHAVIRTDGSGRFVSCPAASSRLRYGVANAVSALTPKQATSQFTGLVQHRFGQAGWPLHPSGTNAAGQRIYSATANGISVTVRFFHDNLGPGAALTVEGKCLNAGKASQTILSSYAGSQADRYPDADATASPVPTSFPAPSS
jgi:hypothetical protein